MSKKGKFILTPISKVHRESKKLVDNELLISGWVRSLRNSKNKLFIVVNDGSCFDNLQIVFSVNELEKNTQSQAVNFGSFITVKGKLIETPNREDKIELKGVEITFLSSASDNYPLQKKEMQPALLRENAHLRSKTKLFLAIFKVRSELNRIIGNFFWKENFFYVNTPIITTNDAEGGGESFRIKDSELKDSFEKFANLSVSGQLHEEALVQGLGKVYNFSPCFRAEKSDTSKHLSEFWMVEAEILSCNTRQLIKLIEKLIKFSLKSLLKTCKKEILYLEEYQSKKIIKDLEEICKRKIPVVTYKKCLDIVFAKNQEEKSFFDFNNIEWGIDFKSEHEKYLCEYFNSPIFIVDYPQKTKAFYAKINKDKKTVAAVDLIFPKVGEIVGGSVREESIEAMEKRINSKNLREELDWYFKLRNYGYSGSAGFGMGFERLMMVITKCDNIRDVIPFHRSFKDLNF